MQSILDGNLYEPMIFTLLLSCARCAVASSISNTISISFTVYAMHEHVCLWKSPCVYYVCLSFALKYLQFRNAFFVRFRINVGVQTQWFILKRIHRDKSSEREMIAWIFDVEWNFYQKCSQRMNICDWFLKHIWHGGILNRIRIRRCAFTVWINVCSILFKIQRNNLYTTINIANGVAALGVCDLDRARIHTWFILLLFMFAEYTSQTSSE